MNATSSVTAHVGVAIRWIARITGLLLVAVFVAISIGEGLPNPAKMPTPEMLMSVFLYVVWLGMIVGWRWPAAGGSMVVAGMAAFYVINHTASGGWPGGWVFPLMWLPGVLFIISSWLARRRRSRGLSEGA